MGYYDSAAIFSCVSFSSLTFKDRLTMQLSSLVRIASVLAASSALTYRA